jgi:hypothetical protein
MENYRNLAMTSLVVGDCVVLADLFPHSMLWHECLLAWCHTLSLLLLV